MFQIGTVSREDAHWATGNSEHGGTGMAKVNEAELGDDFSYIFRIAELEPHSKFVDFQE
jgi:hypothetical protein